MAKRPSLDDRILPKTSCCSQYSELFYILAAYDKYYTSSRENDIFDPSEMNKFPKFIRFSKAICFIKYYHKQTVRTAEETVSNGTVNLVAHRSSHHSFTG